MTGRIVRLHRRGFGFIETDFVGEPVFFAAWAVDRGHGYAFDDLRPGMIVTFDLTFDERTRPQAQHVRSVQSSALRETR